MNRLLEFQSSQPAAMQLGPGWLPVMAAVAQQKARKLLTRPAPGMHRVETGAHQVAHGFASGVRDPYRRQLARPVQTCQAGRIPSIGLHPVAGSPWDQRGGDHDTVVPARR